MEEQEKKVANKPQTEDKTIQRFIKLYQLENEELDVTLFDTVYQYYVSNDHFEREEKMLLKLITDILDRK